MQNRKIVLTGDRPTGPLHLGHYVGSLKNRLEFQEKYHQFVMIADVQALTDNFTDPKKVRDNVLEVALDYLSIGLDPEKNVFFIQSLIPAIAELTVFYLNLVTWNRLMHNPTVKQEIAQKNFKEGVPAGFLIYPVSQAADITFVRAELVPVGADQLPVIEQTNEIVRKFNSLYKQDVLQPVTAIIPQGHLARLPGIDGQSKMSKSLGNAIFLSDTTDALQKKVMKMYTDPLHLRIEDPGNVEGNPVFMYLDAFDRDPEKLYALKDHYQRGGLGDVVLKKRLLEELEAFLTPIRERRAHFAKDPGEVMRILLKGSQKAQEKGGETLALVKQAMHLNY